MNTLPSTVELTESVTTEGDLHLIVDGKRIDPFERTENSYFFNIPSGAKVMRLRSRSSEPSKLGISPDSRKLGVCISSLTVETMDKSLLISFSPDHRLFNEGFYEAEGQAQRWTNGDAALPSLLLGYSIEALTLRVVAKSLDQYYINESTIENKFPVKILKEISEEISLDGSDSRKLINVGSTVNLFDSYLSNHVDQSIDPKLADYDSRVTNELNNFKDVEIVHDLPNIYHYWSNKYLLPKISPFGFTNPEDFFVKYISNLFDCYPNQIIKIVSIGSGNCDAEIKIACSLVALGFQNFTIDCLDLNSTMLTRGNELAISIGMERFINVIVGDFNNWQPICSYHAVMANQSLHHVTNLEHLFTSIEKAITLKNGILMTSDIIGMNGHQRWPESLNIVNEFWGLLPEKYKYNHQLKRHEDSFLNWNCASESFEGIRAQDILPLLLNRFHFDLFIPFANLITPFIDRSFGPNYDVKSEYDRDMIDRIQIKDELEISSGRIKPTQMYAVLSLDFSRDRQLSENLTPEFCVRQAD